jgi:hypothetical protein
MRTVRTLTVGLGLVVALAALAAGGAQAKMSRLVLKSGGITVAAGSPAGGSLAFGPCGSLVSTGTLAGNSLMVDKAQFTSFESNAGGCGEGGPSASGKLTNIDVTANGVFTAFGEVTYRTELPHVCEYAIKKLVGRFKLPGATEARLAGTGKRVRAGSEKGCGIAVHVSEVSGELDDALTGTAYEAEET